MRGQGAFMSLERLQQHYRSLYVAAMHNAALADRASSCHPHHKNYVPDRELVGFSESNACEVVASMLQLSAEDADVKRFVATLKQQR